MSLPGKLCIGILEEDNPLKSYFLFKPLLIESEGKYIPYEETQIYPENGCIRIVPDKNESCHFKIRMRRIGLFCVVDLTDHPNENDKIRPNKNYHQDSTERNAFIIYSDVVREPAPDMIYQILPADAFDANIARPHTSKVILREAGALESQCYTWEAMEEDEDQARLSDVPEPCAIEEMQAFDCTDFQGAPLAFAILLPDKVAQAADLPPQDMVSTTEKTSMPKEDATLEEAPLAMETAPELSPELPEKPWICHDERMAPQPVDARLSLLQQLRASQTGLNPRRGRNLQELIEEKWQHSRLNQLGHPVDSITTIGPVANPVECAVEAVRSVWINPQMRESLMQSLSDIDEFGLSLQEYRKAAREKGLERHLNELEAQRLRLLGELESLRANKAALRQQLKQEIFREEDAALSKAMKRTAAAQDTQARYEKLAEDARNTAQQAMEALNGLANGQFEQKLREFALNSHIWETLEQLRCHPKPVMPLALQPVDIEALLRRMAGRFVAEGWNLNRREALNLCACAVLSPLLIISGAPGSGKTKIAHMLADALGWSDPGQFLVFAPGAKSLAQDGRIAALQNMPDTPALILLDDANLYDIADPLRGLSPILDDSECRVCMTLQDTPAGNPLCANMLDRGFTLRLSPQNAATRWEPSQKTDARIEPPVSLNALRQALLPQLSSAVPEALIDKMQSLREELAKMNILISRRALDDTWNYCAIMNLYLEDGANAAEILDMAMAQRILPALLAFAPPEGLIRLPALLKDMPVCQSLLRQPMPILI